MSDVALFLIGLFVFLNVASAILFVAWQDAVDRKRERGRVDSAIDEKLIEIVGDDRAAGPTTTDIASPEIRR